MARPCRLLLGRRLEGQEIKGPGTVDQKDKSPLKNIHPCDYLGGIAVLHSIHGRRTRAPNSQQASTLLLENEVVVRL